MTYFEDLIWLFTSNEQSRGIVRLNIAEGALLYKYCCKVKNGILLEIGRKFGGSTALMAAALDQGRLYSIDIVDHLQAHQHTEKWADKITFLTSDSKKMKWNPSLDLLFIDGDHSYSGVKNDINNFSPFVNKNGYMILHDVIGKKSELQPLINKLLKKGWKREAVADSMLVLKKL